MDKKMLKSLEDTGILTFKVMGGGPTTAEVAAETPETVLAYALSGNVYGLYRDGDEIKLKAPYSPNPRA